MSDKLWMVIVPEDRKRVGSKNQPVAEDLTYGDAVKMAKDVGGQIVDQEMWKLKRKRGTV